MSRNLMLSLALTAALVSTALAADWPHWRGPDKNGIAPDKGINKDWPNKPPKKLWEFAMRDRGHAGPAVADGKVFIVDHEAAEVSNDVVRALDLVTGQELWNFPYPELNLEGKPAKEDHGYNRCTPLIEDNRVYVVSRFGLLHCLDAKTGDKIWSRNLCVEFKGTPPTWGIAMSPVIDGNKLIVCPGAPDASVAALDKLTGKTLWQGGGTYKLGYATPVVATLNGKKQYLVFHGTDLISVDPDNGKVLWNHTWRAAQCTATPIIVGDDNVFITTWYDRKAGALLKVQNNTPQVLWENKNLMSKMSTPVLFDGHLYGNDSGTGSLVCVDVKTGELKWKAEGFEQGGLCAVDGVVLALDGKTGDLVMAEMTPARYNELGRTKPFTRKKGLVGNVWCAPIVADGKAIVRDRNTLVCLDLK